MALWRKAACPGPWLHLIAGVFLLSVHAQAQEAPALVSTPDQAQEAAAPLLTLDQDRFFVESDFGRAVLERERAETAALEQENKRIESELVAEEQALTDQRKDLTAEDFAARASEFDDKVERIRSEQDAKARRLVEQRDQERKEFLRQAAPILGELLGERKATAIVDKGFVIVALSAIDITDEAIAKLNAALVQPAPAP